LQILALYRDEIERVDAIIQATPGDALAGRWPTEIVPTFRLADLRTVLLHVITETAGHAVHLDAACEPIDGRTLDDAVTGLSLVPRC
jgi:hypothetical protein